MTEKNQHILDIIAQKLFDKGAKNIIGLNVKGMSTLTDYYIIAEGNVDRHVIALAQHLEEELQKYGESLLKSEGIERGDWVVLDFGNIMVHLFIPVEREKYELEQLWHDAQLLDLHINVKSAASHEK